MAFDTAALDRAEELFAAGTDMTVGIEEEFSILDPATLDLLPRFEVLRDAASPELAAQITGELISSEIEIISGRGEDLADALERQRFARRALFAHVEAQGVALGATGTHPWADYREQDFIATEHYRRVAETLGYVAARNNTFSLHVHAGVRGLDRAVKVCDRLRGVLPTLLALSASSPFLEGRDTRLASARTQTFTRSFPRCGIPDPFGGWDGAGGFRAYLESLIRWNSIVEYTQVWWSVRPHLDFGTVEVRICDVQPTAAESDALVGLIVACVAAALRDVDEGRPFTDPAPRLLEENLWRAIRHGMDGRLIDTERLEEVDARAAVEALAAWSGAGLAGLPLRNGAQRQRDQTTASGGGALDLREAFAASVAETRLTYSA